MKEQVKSVQKQENVGAVKQKATEKLALVERLAVSTARRLSALEPFVSGLNQDFGIMREATSLLNRKIDAMAALLGLDAEAINSKMTELQVVQLKKMIDDEVEVGNLVATVEVSESSVIVGQEVEKGSGKVINPRIQFSMGSLDKDFAQKLVGKTAGAVIDGGESNLDLLISEVYEVVKAEEESEAGQDNPVSVEESQEIA